MVNRSRLSRCSTQITGQENVQMQPMSQSYAQNLCIATQNSTKGSQLKRNLSSDQKTTAKIGYDVIIQGYAPRQPRYQESS